MQSYEQLMFGVFDLVTPCSIQLSPHRGGMGNDNNKYPILRQRILWVDSGVEIVYISRSDAVVFAVSYSRGSHISRVNEMEI